jgi:hypothetical protein
LIYIGRAVFDGSQITSITSYALKGRFEQFVSISLLGGNFSQTISHNIGYIPSKIQFFASQASDYSQNLEPLSVNELSVDTFSAGSLPVFDPGTSPTFNANSSGATFTAGDLPSLTPGTLPSLTSGTLQRSVISDHNDMTIRVKNATNGLFYKSFDGVAQTSGFLLVVAER